MQFSLNIMGQVKEIKLSKSKALWPLFETIVNAIQSIEDSVNSENGVIEIIANRITEKQIDINGNEEITPFKEFIVRDNGDGFNCKNYNSFLEAYSNLKVSKGCKGIGRFLWLKAFENVHIESNYFEENSWKKRSFDFNIKNGIENEHEQYIEDCQYRTEVTLSDFIYLYRNEVSPSLSILAKKIIEHCLPYFLSDKCPKIILIDGDGEKIDLNESFEKTIKDSLHHDLIKIKEEQFMLYHICMHEGADKHELHLCANNREVRSFPLSRDIPNLQKRIISDDRNFYYVGYLIGDYLDKTVNTNRTSFEFDEADTIFDGVTEKELIDVAYEYIRLYLSEDLDKIQEEKIEQIDKYVRYKKPQYRYVLNKNPEIYEQLPAGLSEDKLELELHKQTQKWELHIKEQGREIDKKIKESVYDTPAYIELFKEYCSSLSEISRVSLAEYVVRRKAILELLEKSLELNEKEEYNAEDSIHSIICPMRVTSDEVQFEEMNLWIIDDRLAYHHFLASDKQMKSLPVLESNISKRMDIAIFDQAISFSVDKNDINSISIIELKKPQRNNLAPDDKNPINQVLNYVDDIKSGKVKKANGRDFGEVQDVAFYCYVIADMTSSLKKDAANAGLTRTPDKGGYFGYNAPRGAYIEVISYDKLIKDAKQRNQVLFDKLFEPKIEEIIDSEIKS